MILIARCEYGAVTQAFSVRARPAVDSLEAVVDRTKMNIYTTFAKYGLPCPISGHPSSLAKPQQSDSQQAS